MVTTTKKSSAGNNKPRAPSRKREPTSGSFKAGNSLGRGAGTGKGVGTLYKEEYAQGIVDFFANRAKDCIVEGIDAQENYKAIAKNFVTIEGFAMHIGVARSTITDWRNAKNSDGTARHPEFIEACEKAQTIQADLLIRGGMVGAFKGGFATMAAMNIAGWKTQAETQIEHSVSDESLNKFAEIAERNKQKSAEMMEKIKNERNITS